MSRWWITVLCAAVTFAINSADLRAQGYGVELHNILMPVSGGMGGTSIARAMDVPSALNGNPSNLARFRGTQFCNSGAWVEPTFNVGNSGSVLPNVGEFQNKSEAQGNAIGNIAIAQDLRALGVPGTLGIGLLASSGAGVSLRGVPASNGTSALIGVLEIGVGLGLDLTDNLSVGTNLMMGNSTFDGPFVGLGAAAYDYALRGAIGLNYDLDRCTQVGVYYQTKQGFTYDDAIRLEFFGGAFSQAFDVELDLPRNVGFGIASDRFMGGRLLLAADVIYKNYSDTSLFSTVYHDQWLFSTGMQYKVNRRVRLRLGYVYAENAMIANPTGSIGGIDLPGTTDALQYVQALLPAINPHRMTGGIGIRDALPGIDIDLIGGGMFNASEQFGESSAELESYWVGVGLTWRFGRGSCCRLPVPEQW